MDVRLVGGIRMLSVWLIFAIVLGMVAAIPPVAQSQTTQTEQEPNDTSEESMAVSIGMNNPITAAIDTTGDVDWYSFQAVAGNGYSVELFEVANSLGTVEGYNCGYTRAGIFPVIYDPALKERAKNCDNNGGGTVQTTASVTANTDGTFYVKVQGHSSDVSGSYKLRILPKHGETGAAWDTTTFEPNNTRFTAYAITPGYQQALTSTIDPRSTDYYSTNADEDWYRFEAQGSESYVVEVFNVDTSLGRVKGYNCGYDRAGLWLEGFDPQGNSLVKNCDDSWGAEVETGIIIDTNTPGTFYVRVMPSSHDVSGSYSIRVLPHGSQEGAAWDEQTFEPNNSIANGYVLQVGRANGLHSTIEGRNPAYFGDYADADWYAFTVEAGTHYQVELFDIDSSLSQVKGYNCGYTRAGLWLHLFDVNGTELQKECDQDSIEFTANQSGTYTVRVAPHSNDVSGGYGVRVALPDNPDDWPFSCSDVTDISEAECDALVALYNGTGGATWTNSDNWMDKDTPPCSWYGISCTNSHVTVLGLSDNNLSGQLPTDMTALRWLQRLNYSGNDVCEPGDDAFQKWINGVSNASDPNLCPAAVSVTRTDAGGTAAPGGSLSLGLALQATTGNVDQTSVQETLPEGVTFIQFTGDVPNGLSYNESTRQIIYNGPVSVSQPMNITYDITINNDVAPGTVLNIGSDVEGGGETQNRDTSISVPNNEAINTLLLIYYGADNDLSRNGMEVLNSAEEAADNPNVMVRMMLDGPGVDDAYIYQLEHDATGPACPGYANPTCDGRYVLNQNMWKWYDDSTDPAVLAEFVKSSLQAHPNAKQVILSMVGHGSGISAKGLTGQPGRKRRRYDPLAGLLRDNNPQGTSLSTSGLGDGLREGLSLAQRSKLDGIYLDACLMGMFEIAYEVRDTSSYLLTSPNIKWAVSDYATHIRSIDGTRNARDILAAWMQNEVTELKGYGGHPYTYVLVDLAKMEALQKALDTLSTTLIDNIAAEKAAMESAFEGANFFDSNGDSTVGPTGDTYVDLASFVHGLQSSTTGLQAVSDAAKAVETALNSALVEQAYQSGSPWDATGTWDWEEPFGGLSIYMPFNADEWQRGYYGERHFSASENGQWDELVSAYWDNVPPPDPPDTTAAPTGRHDINPNAEPAPDDGTPTPTPDDRGGDGTPTPTPDGGGDTQQTVYLPLVRKAS